MQGVIRAPTLDPVHDASAARRVRAVPLVVGRLHRLHNAHVEGGLRSIAAALPAVSRVLLRGVVVVLADDPPTAADLHHLHGTIVQLPGMLVVAAPSIVISVPIPTPPPASMRALTLGTDEVPAPLRPGRRRPESRPGSASIAPILPRLEPLTDAGQGLRARTRGRAPAPAAEPIGSARRVGAAIDAEKDVELPLNARQLVPSGRDGTGLERELRPWAAAMSQAGINGGLDC
jgi:hypothetical protein